MCERCRRGQWKWKHTLSEWQLEDKFQANGLNSTRKLITRKKKSLNRFFFGKRRNTSTRSFIFYPLAHISQILSSFSDKSLLQYQWPKIFAQKCACVWARASECKTKECDAILTFIHIEPEKEENLFCYVQCVMCVYFWVRNQMPTMKSRDINQKYSTYLKCQPIICVCAEALCFIHTHQTPPNDKNKLHNQFNNRAKWKCECVCQTPWLFMREWGAFFFAFFRSPQANTSKVRDCCFPKSFGQHLLGPHTFFPTLRSLISHQDGVRIRREYFWRGNPAVRQIPTKTDGPWMTTRSHTHTYYTDTDTHNTINGMDFCSFVRTEIKCERQKTVATATGGTKLQRKEEGTISHFWANCLLTFSIRRALLRLSRMMPMIRIFCSSIFFFLLLFGVHESWKHFVIITMW